MKAGQKRNAIAVVGMAGKFPGAENPAQFWDYVCAGKEALRRLSDNELRLAGVSETDIDDENYVRVSSVLEDFDKFDARFFGVAPVEAQLMDPQIRLMLQCAWLALEDAGYATGKPQNIGVFSGMGGISTNYYSNFVNIDDSFDKHTASLTHIANDKDYLSTHVSYRLNLLGPSMTIQSACSTSLVAVHQACLSLLDEECDMALAGGVNVRVPHGRGYRYTKGHIFSKSGRIRSFDADADGVVFGNGLGLVLLKRLEDAERDGDHIYAVVKSSALSNDGSAKLSFGATCVLGQVACIERALAKAGVDAGDIGFVEAHGTGTPMGDPIEVSALTKAFYRHARDSERRQYCALGSVKASLGHLDTASGIAGFIKAVLAVSHGRIPPAIHFRKSNPRIDFENTPFFVNNRLQEWPNDGRPRMAGVNSLGIGGTNAFVVLEQHIPESPVALEIVRSDPACVVPLSAKSPASLQRAARKLADFLATDAGGAAGIQNIAYTLQVGRAPMPHRVAFVASSTTRLSQLLDDFLLGSRDSSACFVSPDRPVPIPDGPNELASAIASMDWRSVANLWANAVPVDWLTLPHDSRVRRLSLPGYSFDLERHWVEKGDEVAKATEAAGHHVHPIFLRHRRGAEPNVFHSRFSGAEAYLADHRVQGRRVLPGVVYLEMARAAVVDAVEKTGRSKSLELRNTVWIRPIVVDDLQRVTTRLDATGGATEFSMRSETDDAEVVHCQGEAVFVNRRRPDVADLKELELKMTVRVFDRSELYAGFERVGLDYGPAHRTLVSVKLGAGQLLAEIRLPAPSDPKNQPYFLHPGVMDGALQSSLCLIMDISRAEGEPPLPFSLDTLRIHAGCADHMYAWVRPAVTDAKRSRIARFDIDLLTAEGRVCVQMRGFSTRIHGATSGRHDVGDAAPGCLMATPCWEPSAAQGGEAANYGQSHVVLAGLPAIDARSLERSIGSARIEVFDINGEDPGDSYARCAQMCFERVRELIRTRPRERVCVQLVAANDSIGRIFGGIAGLFRCAMTENPGVTGQVLLVDGDIGTNGLARRLAAEKFLAYESLVSYTGDERYVQRWRDVQASTLAERAGLKSNGVYLITGGLGRLGVHIAKSILDQTSGARVVLTGRSARSDIAEVLVDRFGDGASRVSYLVADLTDRAQMARLLAGVVDRMGQLNGILHLAGAVRDNFIINKSDMEFRHVLDPKLFGAESLDHASRNIELDFFALFSSASGLLGSAGQSDYAVANGFLDGFAVYRNELVAAGQRHGKTLAINWSLWADGGMRMDAQSLRSWQEQTGMRPMRTSSAIAAFYNVLQRCTDRAFVGEGNVARMRATLARVPGDSEPQSDTTRQRPSQPSSAIADSSFSEAVVDYLCKELSTVLKLRSRDIDPRRPMEDYGIDSMLAIGLTNKLEKVFGSLSKTLFFEYQTIAELAEFFIEAYPEELRGIVQPEPAAEQAARLDASTHRQHDAVPAMQGAAEKTQHGASPKQNRSPVTDRRRAPVVEPIAIVGLSGRYPGATNINEYWLNLRNGKDCITEVPVQRWDWREYFSEDRTKEGFHFSKWGGFIDGVDEFDPLFFNISPKEAVSIDPQERLFLQQAWAAMEDAGYTRKSLTAPGDERRVGVYVGVMYSEYQLFGVEAGLQGQRTGFASSQASIANRVSYCLDLHGPSMTVDTMCSSSLTAIHLACQDLLLNRTSLAIAGGVNVSVHPNKYLMLSAGQFISSAGHCQSFGEGGDGYIPGEGVGAVILQRLADAERDNNHVYGLIMGSAINHGGKTNGYTVPNPTAQTDAISQALTESGVDKRHISYIEAHGTGTKLGDPIEITALTKAFSGHNGQPADDRGQPEPCFIGSVKSNVGHCESAAGIAGLTKVLMQIRHREIAPSLHSERLNPHIDFGNTPFVVNQRLRPWKTREVNGREVPRCAGLSSFGAGGSNAHLIIQEYTAPSSQGLTALRTETREEAVLLSARTSGQLRRKAEDLLAFLSTPVAESAIRNPEESMPSLQALAYTLQTGREAMAKRLAILVRSVDELKVALRAYLSDDGDADNVYAGEVRHHKQRMNVINQDDDMQEAVDRWLIRRKLSKLVDFWVTGLAPDWNKLWLDQVPARISLPAYPFARDRYWIDVVGAPRPGDAQRTGRIHPLLHRNTSSIDGLAFESVLGEADFTDERAALSLGAQLALLREALKQVSDPAADAATVSLYDIVLGLPFVADGQRTLRTDLWTNDADAIEFELSSETAGEQRIHCQGEGRVATDGSLSAPVFAGVDGRAWTERLEGTALRERLTLAGIDGSTNSCVTSLQCADDELLAEVAVSGDARSAAYGVHPLLFDGALNVARVLMGVTAPAQRPVSVRRVTIAAPGAERMRVSARRARSDGPEGAAFEVDIDLVTTEGELCARLRGVSYDAVATQMAAVAEPQTIEPQTIEPVSIEPVPSEPVSIEPVQTSRPVLEQATVTQQGAPPGKPRGIPLAPLLAREVARPLLAKPNAIRLRDVRESAASQGEQTGAVAVVAYGEGVYGLRLNSAVEGNGLTPSVMTGLRDGLKQLGTRDDLKAVLLEGTGQGFGRGGRDEVNALIETGVCTALAEFGYPLIGVLAGDALGAGWLLGSLCDVLVCSEAGRYGYTDAGSGLFASEAEETFFEQRFGPRLTQDLLHVTPESGGADLLARGWSCAVVPRPQVLTRARELAQTLCGRPGVALSLLKGHLSRDLVESVRALRPVTEPAATALRDAERFTAGPWEVVPGDAGIGELRLTLGDHDAASVTQTLSSLWTQLDAAGQYKVLVWCLDGPTGLPASVSEASLAALHDELMRAPLPLIGALRGTLTGPDWLIAQCCDVCLYDEAGEYAVGTLRWSDALSERLVRVLRGPLGRELSAEWVVSGQRDTGAGLRKRVPTLPVTASGSVRTEARTLASRWAAFSAGTLRSWKRRRVQRQTAELPAGLDRALDGLVEDASQGSRDAVEVPLTSPVIRATAQANGVLQVTLEDREARNMYSEALVSGIEEVFAHIERTPEYKVVVLTGYDSYFATGGTRESLLAIQEGRAKFTDSKIYHLPLACRLPVIAAMQGHAMGAGWSFGMFADVVLFSEESRYVSPYMSYGFTPGAGATYVFPRKVGLELARESLLSGQSYRGGELAARGLPMRVLERAAVLPEALALADRMARLSRTRLEEFKRHRRGAEVTAVEQVYAQELAMHEQTFVGQDATLIQIHDRFPDHEDPTATTTPAQTHNARSTAPAGQSLIAVKAKLRSLLATELRLDEDEIEDDTQFVDLGLDSIAGVTWIRKINEEYGTSIEAIMVYSYPTLPQLAGYVNEQVPSLNSPAESEPSDSRPDTAASLPMQQIAVPQRSLTSRRARRTRRTASGSGDVRVQPVAIVGVAGQFPQARTVEELWDNVARGRSCIRKVSPERWDLNRYFEPGDPKPGKTNSCWVGAMDDYALFDPYFFGISPKEAVSIDPQQRLFLQACWHGIENAGYDPRSLAGSRCGVYVGCGAGDYRLQSRDYQLSAQGFTGGEPSVLAGRISYFLDLQGPCLSIETACSSSLVAIANACDSLTMGGSDLALAGGVYVMTGPEMHIKTAQAGMLSANGKCFAFDQRANGFVPGEAVGVVVLKRLADAVAANDRILGVVEGWGVNQDGRTNGITAPNAESQARLQNEVYGRFGIDASDIQLVEAHGTGTKLGDPIEIAALKQSIGAAANASSRCAIGSVKSNIGHCLTAAGIAGVSKLLMALQHKKLPPTANFSKLNKHIDLEGSPFYINDRLREWNAGAGGARRAAISSFGFGGTNAHLVIAEHAGPRRKATLRPQPRYAIPLSAKTPEQLRQIAADLLEFADNAQPTPDMTGLASTLQLGRATMTERLGLVVGSLSQLSQKLSVWLIDDACDDDVFRAGGPAASSSSASAPDIRRWLAQGQLAKVMRQWVDGHDVDWGQLYPEGRPEPVALPLYPFARERYWIDSAASVGDEAFARRESVIHPLVHANVSNLDYQCYRSSFSGHEFFYVGDDAESATARAGKTLSIAAFLEMYRAAAVAAIASELPVGTVELRGLAWGARVPPADAIDVQMALFARDSTQIDCEIYSSSADLDWVYGQGTIAFTERCAGATIDPGQLRHELSLLSSTPEINESDGWRISSIYGDTDRRLVEIRLAQGRSARTDGFVLHPGIVEAALRLAESLARVTAPAASPALSFAPDFVRILRPCVDAMSAWIRPSGTTGGLDIDLCEPNGAVCIELRDVRYRVEALDAPLAQRVTDTSVTGDEPDAVAVVAYGEGVYGLRLNSAVEGNGLTPSVMIGLREGLKQLGTRDGLKAVLLEGTEQGFGRGGRDEVNALIETGVCTALAEFGYPLIGVLAGDALGAGWLLGSLCDVLVCSEAGRYGYTDAGSGLFASEAEETFFEQRFGPRLTQDLLHVTPESGGADLLARGWSCAVVPRPQVLTRARELAQTLCGRPGVALSLLKRHLSRDLVESVRALRPVTEPAATALRDAERFTAGPWEVVPGDAGIGELRLTLGDHDAASVTQTLSSLWSQVDAAGQYKVLVWCLDGPTGLPASVSEASLAALHDELMRAPLPLIGALRGTLTGPDWLIAQCCDVCLYDEAGEYAVDTLRWSDALSERLVRALRGPLGRELSAEWVVSGQRDTGAGLRKRVPTLPVTASGSVRTEARTLASRWAAFSAGTLRSWKRRRVQRQTAELPAGSDQTLDRLVEQTSEPFPDAVEVPLTSPVIRATAQANGVLQVTLEDREARNMYSEALVSGIEEVFAHIEQTPEYKVVVLTGYDSYFATGGTRESLLAIQEGRAKFTDSKIYHLPLACRLPVIAAMQGHAMGAGWSFGMFADVVLFSEESRYVSPYMSYGFTPGAGATWVFPRKVGLELARESLLSGQSYRGGELAARSLPMRVLERAAVLPEALALADRMARLSRSRLEEFKRHRRGAEVTAVEQVYAQELAMHEQTFVGQDATLIQIHDRFLDLDLADPTPQKTVATVPEGQPRDQSTSTRELAEVTATLRRLLAEELEMDEARIATDSQFVDLGVDSIIGVSWINRINELFGTRLEATRIYRYPTLLELSPHVLETMPKRVQAAEDEAARDERKPGPDADTARFPQPAATVLSPVNRTPSLSTLRNGRLSRAGRGVTKPELIDVAIIGMAGQFPLADNVDEYWENIARGRHCIREVPRERWDAERFYLPGDAVPGKTNSKWMGDLTGYDLFDPLFFNISPAEAEHMDPQQRLFLQACWHGIEHAGYDARELSGARCGVYAGCGTNDYSPYPQEMGNSIAILAARIAYFLNLQGPCLSIDTACSSSLVAIASACDNLVSGSADLALAGGVCVLSTPSMHIMTSQANMLSADGKCFSFDQKANGFVPGEAVGVVVLKRLADAHADGDRVLGVIRGWGVNQDGKTNGITAPNPESQSRLQREIYQRHRIDPGGIQLIEAHGTGTKLGDPIEVEGLREAFADYTKETGYCALGSVKSNIGHCLFAAGIAGVIKVLLALRHRQLPPTINFERLNEHIRLDDSPFYINDRLRDWTVPDGDVRQAAISSFGFSGTNAHLVIGEDRQEKRPARAVESIAGDGQMAVLLSARTATALTRKVRDLLAFIERPVRPPDFIDLAYTLQIGREAMEERLGLMARSVEELGQRLWAWLDDELADGQCYRGRAEGHDALQPTRVSDDAVQTGIDECLRSGDVRRLLELWVQGARIDWRRLYGEPLPRRIELPLYPFARQSYWAETPRGIESDPLNGAQLHPLVHSNISDLNAQRYLSRFTGLEPFLADHQIAGGDTPRKVLPGAAYLEMARAAIELAAAGEFADRIMELRDVVWLRQMVVDETVQAITELSVNDGRMDFAIYSLDGSERRLHCQGNAVFTQAAGTHVELSSAQARMQNGDLMHPEIYAAFASVGLLYGPAHRSVTRISRGGDELLAQLRMPDSVRDKQINCALHPSMVDGAFQTSVGLLEDLTVLPDGPAVPYSVDCVRIFHPCADTMTVLLRESQGTTASQRLSRLDIDLCNPDGTVCVELRGFCARQMGSAGDPQRVPSNGDYSPLQAGTDQTAGMQFDAAYYESVVDGLLEQTLSVEDAVRLG